ncbi:MAG: hypothetical protein ACXWOV_09345 [Isosphaeraceae bacterium]
MAEPVARRLPRGMLILCALVILGCASVALVVVEENGFSHGRLPMNTLARTESQAEDVAFSIASNAGCGEFDSEAPNLSTDTWWFTCRMNGRPFGIYVYGSDQARSAGLAKLQATGLPFVGKDYYAVTAIQSGPGKSEALSDTPPASVMDPFR